MAGRGTQSLRGNVETEVSPLSQELLPTSSCFIIVVRHAELFINVPRDHSRNYFLTPYPVRLVSKKLKREKGRERDREREHAYPYKRKLTGVPSLLRFPSSRRYFPPRLASPEPRYAVYISYYERAVRAEPRSSRRHNQNRKNCFFSLASDHFSTIPRGT